MLSPLISVETKRQENIVYPQVSLPFPSPRTVRTNSNFLVDSLAVYYTGGGPATIPSGLTYPPVPASPVLAC